MPSRSCRISSTKTQICVTKVRIAREAREDLGSIRIFSKARFGVATAKAYMQGFETKFALLLERPALGPEQNDLPSGVRAFPSGSHRIYCGVTTGGIEILRVLHQAQSDARDRLA